MPPAELPPSRHAPRRWPRLLPLVGLVLLLGLFLAFGLARYVSLETLRDNRAALGQFVMARPLLAGSCFVLLYIAVTAASIPGSLPLSLAGGFLFGPWLGSLYVVIGATTGATLLFLAARTALGSVLLARGGRLVQRLAAELRHNAASYLLVLRLVPLFPFWLVNLVPALAGVPLRIFVPTTAIGILPATLVYVGVGNGLVALFDAGRTPDLGVILEPAILLPLLGLAALASIPIFYRRFSRRPVAAERDG